MGEELTGDEGFVENATSETEPEVVSTPPADDVTPTEAVVEPGAEKGLEGDDAEIQEYLNQKYGDKLSENDREQIMRWRGGNTEAKTLKAETARLKEEAGAGRAHMDALSAVAQLIPGGVQALKDKGPAEFVKWASGDEPEAKPEPTALDPNDPIQNQMLAMQAQLKAMQDDKDKGDQDRQMDEAAHQLSNGVDALKLKDDDQGTAKGVMVRLAEFHLATGGAVNSQLPTKEEIGAAIKEASKLDSAYRAIITGETEKKIEEGTPKTPEVVAEKEIRPESEDADPDDWDEAEDKGFMDNATRNGG